jgi:hypothetical protein
MLDFAFNLCYTLLKQRQGGPMNDTAVKMIAVTPDTRKLFDRCKETLEARIGAGQLQIDPAVTIILREWLDAQPDKEDSESS